MKIPYKFSAPPPGWADKFPDGDYTIGRGADPRVVLLSPATKESKAQKSQKKKPHKDRKAKRERVAAE